GDWTATRSQARTRPAGLARATRRPGSGRSRVAGDEASFARPSMPWQHRHERQNYVDGDQHDDDPLEDLHPAARRPVRHLGVDTVYRLQLTGDARVPFAEMEAPGRERVHARQVLIAHQLQRV